MALEEEIKLTVADGAALTAILDDPLVRAASHGAAPTPCPFVAVYYDAPGRPLLKNGFGFRARQVGDQWWAGLKGDGPLEAGLSSRPEWEVRFPGPIAAFDDLPPGELREIVLPIVGAGAPLERLMVTDIDRRILMLDLEAGARAELALDQGFVEAGGLREEIVELELERLAGPLAPLQALAAALRRRHGLAPAELTKFHRGLRLLGLI